METAIRTNPSSVISTCLNTQDAAGQMHWHLAALHKYLYLMKMLLQAETDQRLQDHDHGGLHGSVWKVSKVEIKAPPYQAVILRKLGQCESCLRQELIVRAPDRNNNWMSLHYAAINGTGNSIEIAGP